MSPISSIFSFVSVSIDSSSLLSSSIFSSEGLIIGAISSFFNWSSISSVEFTSLASTAASTAAGSISKVSSDITSSTSST